MRRNVRKKNKRNTFEKKTMNIQKKVLISLIVILIFFLFFALIKTSSNKNDFLNFLNKNSTNNKALESANNIIDENSAINQDNLNNEIINEEPQNNSITFNLTAIGDTLL